MPGASLDDKPANQSAPAVATGAAAGGQKTLDKVTEIKAWLQANVLRPEAPFNNAGTTNDAKQIRKAVSKARTREDVFMAWDSLSVNKDDPTKVAAVLEELLDSV